MIQNFKNYIIDKTTSILNSYNLPYSDGILEEHFNFDNEIQTLIDQYTYKISTDNKEYTEITEENEVSLYKELEELILLRVAKYISEEVGPRIISEADQFGDSEED